ncbi:hypothetical protein ABPG74_003787 [Tetrahymena malaccensis]
MLKIQSGQHSNFSENQIRKSNTSYKKWIAATLICLVILFGTCSLIFKGENGQLKSTVFYRNLQKDQKILKFKYDLTIYPKLKLVNGKQISEYLKFQSEQVIQLDQLDLEEQSILITYSKLNQQSTIMSNADQKNEIVSLMSGKESLAFKAKINKNGDFLEFNSLDENQFEVAKAVTKRIIAQSLQIFSQRKSQLNRKRMLFNSTIVYSEVDFFNFSQEQIQQQETIIDPELEVVEEFYYDQDDTQINDQDNDNQNQQEETVHQQDQIEENIHETTGEQQNQNSRTVNYKKKNLGLNLQQNIDNNQDVINNQKYTYDNSSAKFISLKYQQENDNSTIITDDNWSHDGSNFQQDQQQNSYNNNFQQASQRIMQENQNSSITNDNWNHDGSNFQQDQNNHFIDKRLSNAFLKQQNENENITNDYFDHDGSNFQQEQQQNSYDNNFQQAAQRMMQENQNQTITNDNWDHDGSNFQQHSGHQNKRIKFASLKSNLKNENETVINDDNWNHDGSNFQDNQDSHFIIQRLRNSIFNLKQQNQIENITNDNWDHDGKNFQQNSQQQNDYDNYKKYLLSNASQLTETNDSPYQSKEVTIYKNKIFSQIVELRIIQNIYLDYTKFAYILYINNKEQAQIHEVIVNTDSIIDCLPKTQPQEQYQVSKIIEINKFVFGILNIPINYKLNFLIAHSHEMISQDNKCDISFQAQVKVEVDSNIGMQLQGEEEKGFRVKGLLINEICEFNLIVDTQELTLSTEIKKQQGEINYQIDQYYRKQICNLEASSTQAQNIRNNLKSTHRTDCSLSDMQNDEENQTTFVNKGQDESAVTLTKQIEYIKIK